MKSHHIAHRVALSCGMSVLGMAISAQLHAQTTGLDEIVVTAQKRQETAQEIPIAIDVVNADALIREGIKDIGDIAKASPTLEANTRAGGQNVTIGMRGMQQSGTAPTSDGLVAAHLDGAYLASQWGLAGMMYDLDRIEVVAGPQGTLYGRNATAGALNLITRRPGREFEGNASLEYGDYDTVRVQGGVTVPLSETFSARFAGQRLTRDSTFTGGGGGRDQWGTRLTTLWTPSEADELLATFDYNQYNSEADGTALLALAPGAATRPGNIPYVVPSDPYDNLRYQNERGQVFVGDNNDQTQWGVNAQYTHNFTGFSSTLQYAHRDIDGVSHGATKLPTAWSETLVVNKMKSDSVELRFVSTGSGQFTWVGGLFYFKNSNRGFFSAPIGPYGGRVDAATLLALGPVAGAPVNATFSPDSCGAAGNQCLGNMFSPSNGDAKSYAAYGQTTWTPASMDRWHFTGGLRYTYDKKTGDLGTPSGNPNVDSDGAGPLPPGFLVRFSNVNKNWDAVQYKLGAQYDFSDRSMGYATISTGYKSGGFAYGPTPVLEPETVRAYEIGTKNVFLDNTLKFNAAAWFYDYKDLEFAVARPVAPVVGPTGNIVNSIMSVTNVGEARLAGLSFDTDWLFTKDDQLGVSFTYVYSKIIDGKDKSGIQLFYEGERLGDAPKYAVIGRYGHTFTFSGGATLLPQLKYQWQSEKYDPGTIVLTPPAPRHFNKTYTTIPSQGLLDLSLRFAPQSGMWDITGYVNNVTDETDIKLIGYGDGPGPTPNGHQTANLGDPRIWGLILNMRF